MDEKDLAFTNWANNRPLKDSKDSNCVEISVDESNYGKWLDDKCQKKNAVLCQKSQMWSVEQIQKNLIDTIRELKDAKSELDYLKSNPVPIGFIYVQLSAQPEPKTLWPNTLWENISKNYAGLFFRAEGGQAQQFGQTQDEQTQSLWFISHHDVNGQDRRDEWIRVDQSEKNFWLYKLER